MCTLFAATLSAGPIAHASGSLCRHGFVRQPGHVLHLPADYMGPSFSAVDWDSDGDVDILMPDREGRVFVYENEDSEFFRSEEPVARIPVTEYKGCALSVVDWDRDGDPDILAAKGCGNVVLYENTENGFKKRRVVARIPSTIYRGYAFSARDFDGDGKIELLAAEGNGWVYLYEKRNGRFVKREGPVIIVAASCYHGCAISAVDWDGDGLTDILAMDRNGDVVLYKCRE